MVKEPFGQRAVRLGYATSEQVRQGLETQQMLAAKGSLLGEILVEMGWMDTAVYIQILQELVNCGKANHHELQDLFVQKALDRGKVDPVRIDEARKIQANWNRKNKLIGQIMVELGYITVSERDDIMRTYKNDAKPT